MTGLDWTPWVRRFAYLPKFLIEGRCYSGPVWLCWYEERKRHFGGVGGIFTDVERRRG